MRNKKVIPPVGTPTIEDAIAFAALKHKGQKDKVGQTYIHHPLRVMLRLQTDEERIVGILHDVVEDCEVTLKDLRRLGYSNSVVVALGFLSKLPEEDYEAFIRRISAGPALAIKVKLADLADNTDPGRRTEDSEGTRRRQVKYQRAIETLTRALNEREKEVLGIDLGHTIVESTKAKKALIPHALRVIRRLKAERFGDKVHIVSKVSPEQEIRMRAWLGRDKFLERALIPMEQVHFCASRPDKAPICTRLGVTHFIDDRPEVLSHMTGVPHRFLFQGDPDEVSKWTPGLVGITPVESWLEIEQKLLP